MTHNKYDARPEIYAHIQLVQAYLTCMIGGLLHRSLVHDRSKLEEPELSMFNEYTPKLRTLEYGSEDYKQALDEMNEEGLPHHYANNPHHPEYYEDGVKGMSLVDLVEMLCDWKAASQLRPDGDLLQSIEINQHRFGYSDELKQILINTVQDWFCEADGFPISAGKRRAKKWGEV